jgi:cytochrome c oxidase subunit II
MHGHQTRESQNSGAVEMNRNLTTGALALGAMALTATALGKEAKPVERIEVTASRFSFSPNEVTIKKGEPVTISLNSTDVTHGLVVEDLGIRTEVKKGQPDDLTVTPENIGTFQGKCAHFCGKGHGSMTFTVHVVE